MLLAECGLGIQRECLGRIVGFSLRLLTGVYQHDAGFLSYWEIIEWARRGTALHFTFAVVEGTMAGTMELVLRIIPRHDAAQVHTLTIQSQDTV
jgi:hypothetical protein